jgi:hypothetical protein
MSHKCLTFTCWQLNRLQNVLWTVFKTSSECSLNVQNVSLNDPWMFPECSLNVHWMFAKCSLFLSNNFSKSRSWRVRKTPTHHPKLHRTTTKRVHPLDIMMSSPAVCQVLRTNLSPKVACGLRNRRAPKVQACVPRAPGATSFQRNAQCRVGLLMRKSQVLVGYQHNVRLITSSFPRPSYSGARKSTVVAVCARILFHLRVYDNVKNVCRLFTKWDNTYERRAIFQTSPYIRMLGYVFCIESTLRSEGCGLCE